MSSSTVSPKDEVPNDFTIALGQRIRDARHANNMSQQELAARIGRRQASLSDIELGKMEPNATTLLLLAEILNKPLPYFFPPPWGAKASRSDLTYDEQALLLEFRRLKSDEYRKIAINQVAALAEMG